MLKRLRPLTLIAVALLAGALALPAHALQFNYSTRLTLTDCDDADEAGFNTGTTILCYDLTAGREEIYNGSAWVAYQGGGAAITSITPGTGATNAGKARSSSAGATDTGFAPWAVRDDALSTVAEDEGEYTPLKATSTGGLWMSIATPLGDSAMDDTANALKVLSYVTENTYAPGAVTVAGSTTEVVSIDVGSVASQTLRCLLTNENTANDRTINAVDIFISPTATYTDATISYSELDFASPSGDLLKVRTGVPGADADPTPDTSLDELKTLELKIDVSGAKTVGIKMTASGAGASVTPECYY